MTEHDLSDQPPTDGKPATEAPVVAGAGESFDALDSDTPLSVDSEQDGSGQPGSGSGTS
ncbi:hypothetical protein [Jatrophihabitans sp.]|uniref:hypothetical protein n=1 Tax=Jatrophihabitans sp. TaxID=1932789 RepID=UPI002C86FA3A|nr:hypothetical protein [Jatrophihabitans sp.]